jgi:o-succinylbenzoate synthase
VKIDRLELRLLRLPLVHHFETSFGRSYDRSFVLVRASADGVDGYGECVAEQHPYYSPEDTETAWHILSSHVAPRVLGREFAHPRDVLPALASVRGHRMAKAAVEMATWDLYARQQNLPLWQALGGSGLAIAAGVSIGIQDSLEALMERVAAEWAVGYQRIKIKIKPGWDIAVVERLRIRFGDIPLMVDANGAYSPADASRLVALDQFALMMIEQPFEDEDLVGHAMLQAQLRTPICLDESIHSVRDAQFALAAGACRIVNIKPGRLGGHAESIRVHDLCAGHHVPVWHGGMLESGIGRAHNIHLSTLRNFTLPGDVAASRRYYVPDLIDPPIDVRPDGTIQVPEGPGIGVHVMIDRVERATERVLELTAP